jgi:hypothetical protein
MAGVSADAPLLDVRGVTLQYKTREHPEIVREPLASAAFGVVEKPLSTWARIGNIGVVRKLAILIVLALAREATSRTFSRDFSPSY